ncbi:acetylglutamate kinase [Halobacteriales archaeon SW_7_65_23]|nr:MAG: acetylglutamate kinase [Halobacteriales archaeon SW_7_65_23]
MTVVVKIGGARAVDPAGAIADVASLVDSGKDIVVTHGGSTAVDELLDRLGMEPEYVETPDGVVGRFTDEDTMEVFEMVLAGRVNTQLVASLRTAGVDAVGLSGVDGGLLEGPRTSAIRVVEDGKKKIRRGDHSGRPETVNESLLSSLLADGYTPVCSPPMGGIEDDESVTPVNTDADRAAALIAGALPARLVLLTDVPGILADPDDESTLFESVATRAEWERVEDAAEGFMSRKLMAAEESLTGGASEVVVADANAEAPVTAALNGSGTHIQPDALEADRA